MRGAVWALSRRGAGAALSDMVKSKQGSAVCSIRCPEMTEGAVEVCAAHTRCAGESLVGMCNSPTVSGYSQP